VDNPIFFINAQDKKFFIKQLRDYFRFYVGSLDESAVKEKADKSFQHLICGMDLDGNPLDNSNLKYFDEILSLQTGRFYVPADANRTRYEKGRRITRKKVAKKADSTLPLELSGEQTKRVEHIKKNLLFEYPYLDRKDLQEDIDNYCLLKVKINILLQNDSALNATAVKNLVDTLVRLGSYLGINEEEKMKKKSFEDRQSVAALSMQFQKTIDNFPFLLDRFKYEEIRILLEKYDRQELSKNLFESPYYAGMPIENARAFIIEREPKYEAAE
jgi:hypothetical protein